MKKIPLLIILLTSGFICATAQDAQVSKPLYENITEMGFLAGPMTNSRPAPFTISNVSSFRVTPNIYAGPGVGIEFIGESYLPLFLDLRYFFRDEKFSPFIGFQSGYNIALSSKSNISPWYSYPEYALSSSFIPYPYPYYGEYNPAGGFFINPQAGFKNMFNEHLGFIFSIGYRYQQMNYNAEDSENNMLFEYNRLSIKLGFIFN